MDWWILHFMNHHIILQRRVRRTIMKFPEKLCQCCIINRYYYVHYLCILCWKPVSIILKHNINNRGIQSFQGWIWKIHIIYKEIMVGISLCKYEMQIAIEKCIPYCSYGDVSYFWLSNDKIKKIITMIPIDHLSSQQKNDRWKRYIINDIKYGLWSHIHLNPLKQIMGNIFLNPCTMKKIYI